MLFLEVGALVQGPKRMFPLSVLLKLHMNQYAYESPRDLAKMQIQILGWSLRFCISKQLMVDAIGVGLWTTL